MTLRFLFTFLSNLHIFLKLTNDLYFISYFLLKTNSILHNQCIVNIVLSLNKYVYSDNVETERLLMMVHDHVIELLIPTIRKSLIFF